jgi:hypothetical protein
LINNCDPTTNTTYIKESIVAPVPDGAGGPFLSMKKNLVKKYVIVKNPNIPIDKPADIIVYLLCIIFSFFCF